MLHFFIGTKAQYIKTAPVMRELDRRGVRYRLIDSGQHGEFSQTLRHELKIRPPDLQLGSGVDVNTIPHAARWAGRVATRLVSARGIRRDLFAGQGGLCIVHGDTPSTLLATLLARRAGLEVAHLEAGLRSHHPFHPFPEELIRILVMRRSELLFAPDEEALANLDAMGLAGRAITTPGNTVRDALRHSLDGHPIRPSGPAVATMHRVENLKRADRLSGFVDIVARMARRSPVRVVLHGPTERALARRGLLSTLVSVAEVGRLQSHADFARSLARAPLVVTDGGSIQEECAILGVPTLLWRGHTERLDGIGRNVLLSRYDPVEVETFLADPEPFRRPPDLSSAQPSVVIADHLESYSGLSSSSAREPAPTADR